MFEWAESSIGVIWKTFTWRLFTGS